MLNLKALGELIGMTRTQQDISRAKLSRLTGLDESLLLRIEKGIAKKVRDKDLKKIFDALNMGNVQIRPL